MGWDEDGNGMNFKAQDQPPSVCRAWRKTLWESWPLCSFPSSFFLTAEIASDTIPLPETGLIFFFGQCEMNQ